MKRGYYTYQYLRKDGSPYYAGKGSNGRVYRTHKGHYPPKNADGSVDYSRIRIQYWQDEVTALAYEIYIIDFWGRKDLGTGILHNRTDGGDTGPHNIYAQQHAVSGFTMDELNLSLSLSHIVRARERAKEWYVSNKQKALAQQKTRRAQHGGNVLPEFEQ
jgi:hypothetical protein